MHREFNLCGSVLAPYPSVELKVLNYRRRPKSKEASGKRGSAFNAVEGVGYLFERKIKLQEKFLWGYKVIKVEVAHRAIVLFLMVVINAAELLCLFLQLVVFVQVPFKMFMAKGMKRLVGRCKQYNSHKHQVEYGKPSFHVLQM